MVEAGFTSHERLLPRWQASSPASPSVMHSRSHLHGANHAPFGLLCPVFGQTVPSYHFFRSQIEAIVMMRLLFSVRNCWSSTVATAQSINLVRSPRITGSFHKHLCFLLPTDIAHARNSEIEARHRAAHALLYNDKRKRSYEQAAARQDGKLSPVLGKGRLPVYEWSLV